MTTTAERTQETVEVTFTGHELAALLPLRPGPAADLSRQVLRLNGLDVAAGLTGLAARGLADLTPEHARPLGPASVVGYALTGALRWTSITLDGPEGGGGVLLVDADTATLAVTVRAPGLFDVLPLEPGPGGLEVVVPTLTAFLDGAGARSVAVLTATTTSEQTFLAGTEADAERGAAAIAGTTYWVDHGDGEHQHVDRSGLLHLLRLAVGHTATRADADSGPEGRGRP